MRADVLFLRPLTPQATADGFEDEALAVEMLDLDAHVIPFDLIVDGEADRAVEQLPEGGGRTYLLRSWILSLEEYEALDEALAERGDQLVSTPEEYERTLYLPEWAPLLGERTPASIWTDGAEAAEAYELARTTLGPPPWILKDHVKSAKEQWLEACFVAPETTEAEFTAMVDNLLTERGERFERGLVVRKFVDLAPLPYSTEERRIPDEHRLVFFEGELIASSPYHDVEDPEFEPVDFHWVADALDAPFVTVDVARLRDEDPHSADGWTVIEINPGEVTTWPAQMDPRALYKRLLD